MTESIRTYQELISQHPQVPTENLDSDIRIARAAVDAVIVLDDDPTGTQTVYDIPVVTNWDLDTIREELLRGTDLFYILTNSRSLTTANAEQIAIEIGQNIFEASTLLNKKCLVISRGDSTLRGHYPVEVSALEKGLHLQSSVHFVIPAFFEGGRFTIDNIHYVRMDDTMVPAGQTDFARDKVFGFKSSDLREWVVEKWEGKISQDRVKSISIEELRTETSDYLRHKISGFQEGDVCIVNAFDYSDLKKVALAICQSDMDIVCRTAASFVAAMAAQPTRSLLNGQELGCTGKVGGLIIVGSYVPLSTRQLAHMQENTDIKIIEINVAELLTEEDPEIMSVVQSIEDHLRAGQDVVLSTTRKLISSIPNMTDLKIGKRVSDYLCEIVAAISVRPKYILAKGGITSSDIATKSMKVVRAIVRGQIIPGVPVWSIGKEGRFPNLPYIIFPGNVGDDDSLTTVVEKLKVLTT